MKKFPLSQSLQLLKSHAVTSGFIFVFGILIFAGVITHNVGSVIFSAAATVIYFFSIYGTAFEIAMRDKKSYTPEQPYPLKGLLLAVSILIASALLYALYFIAWKLMTINGTLFSAAGWIDNFLFIIWSFPFSAFINLSEGYMSVFGYVFVAVLPFIASFAGYFAGYKDFDLHSKLLGAVYEKKKNGNTKK